MYFIKNRQKVSKTEKRVLTLIWETGKLIRVTIEKE